MASQQNDNGFDQIDEEDEESLHSQDDDDLENDDVLIDNEDEDDDYLHSFSTSVVASVPINPAPIAQFSPKPEQTPIIHDDRKPQSFEESRRLFQRLWTDEDEIELLRGFLDFTMHRSGTHHDTAVFYDQIRSKLQLDFNKNQLVEKLRRLKKKYRNVMGKMSSGKEFCFKSSHDKTAFELSHKIWRNSCKIRGEDVKLEDEELNAISSVANFPTVVDNDVKIEAQKLTPRTRKRARPQFPAMPNTVAIEGPQATGDIFISNNHNNGSGGGTNVSNMLEETLKSCLLPLFKELLSNGSAGLHSGREVMGLAKNAIPLNFAEEELMDEKWKKQQILELEVYSKRLELVQDQIKARLEELRAVNN